MEVLAKLQILSAAAKYDASCASSGSTRRTKARGIGSPTLSGICHSWSEDGRCISLLKVLFTNECIYDCTYCVNRASSNTARASFTPRELAELTIGFYKRNYIEGLFLSSSVVRSPNHTMELLLQTVKLLRNEHDFHGYIHLKVIPGADDRLVNEAGYYVDRMSVNIELPSNESLRALAPQKHKQAILAPMARIDAGIQAVKEERTKISNTRTRFVPAGQSTQLIVGATPDSDLTIIRLSESLYSKFRLKRVYYSAFMPVSTDPRLSAVDKPPLVREHRLYQADWLLRFYGFQADELLTVGQPQLELGIDPKVAWALNNLDQFPVEINSCDYWMLLRIPGVGVKSAQKILRARRVGTLGYDQLRKIGVVLKRARYFITCQGQYFGGIDIDSPVLRSRLEELPSGNRFEQLPLFPQLPALTDYSHLTTGISGKI